MAFILLVAAKVLDVEKNLARFGFAPTLLKENHNDA